MSPQRVAAGSLDRFLRRDRKSIRYRIPVDKRFLDELTEWRRDLASNIHRLNADLDIRELNDIVQRLLDRIVFIRIAEERKVIEPGQLRELVELWEQRGGKVPIIQDLVGLFSQINEDFNGEIFKPHPSERVRIDSSVLVRIIRRLYPPKSPYRFDVIGVELLGSIYERYLGNTLQLFPIKWLDASEFVLPPDLDPKYIVALLNSKLLDWYLKKISVRAYQTAFMYVRKYIEQLPIKLPNGKSGDPPEHDLILEKVEKIIQLTSRAVATKDVSANEQQIRAADRAIDTLVYKLYDLTDEQVGIVEGAG